MMASYCSCVLQMNDPCVALRGKLVSVELPVQEPGMTEKFALPSVKKGENKTP